MKLKHGAKSIIGTLPLHARSMKAMHSYLHLCMYIMLCISLSACGRKTIVVSGTLPQDESTDAGSKIQEQKEAETESPVMTVDVKVQVESPTITVYVCGAVNTPGVYHLPEGARIYEAIALAGGMTDKADPESCNQAGVLKDAQMLRILTKEEIRLQILQSQGDGTSDIVYQGSGDGEAVYAQELPGYEWLTGSDEASIEQQGEHTGKINLNTASKEELLRLPGIGEAKAEAILAYRSEHGAFSSIEEIQQISGIKAAVFAKIKDHICV